jgi:hypothetical protein
MQIISIPVVRDGPYPPQSETYASEILLYWVRAIVWADNKTNQP